MLNKIGIEDGIRPIKIGDMVRVNYLGNEDFFSNQLRNGRVKDITLTQRALDFGTPELLIYTMEAADGQIFQSCRRCLDRLI